MAQAATSSPSELSSPSSRGSPVKASQSEDIYAITSPRRRIIPPMYTNTLFDAMTPRPIHGSITLREPAEKAATVATPKPALSFKPQCQCISPSIQSDGLTVPEVRRDVQWAHMDIEKSKSSGQGHPELSRAPAVGLREASTGFGTCTLKPVRARLQTAPQAAHGGQCRQPSIVIASALHDLHSSPTPGGAAEVAQLLFSAPPRSCQQLQANAALAFRTPEVSSKGEHGTIQENSVAEHGSHALELPAYSVEDPPADVDTHARLHALLCTSSARQSPSVSIDSFYDQLLHCRGDGIDGVSKSGSVTPVSRVIDEHVLQPIQLDKPYYQSRSMLGTLISTSAGPAEEPPRDRQEQQIHAIRDRDGLLSSNDAGGCVHVSNLGAQGPEQQLPAYDIMLQLGTPSAVPPSACTCLSRPDAPLHSPRTPTSHDRATCSPFTLANFIPSNPSELKPNATPGSWLVSGKGIRESMDCGPENLPELSDEQFAHASMVAAADRAPTADHAAGHQQCTLSRASVSSETGRWPVSYRGQSADEYPALSEHQGIHRNQLLQESVLRRSITDVVTNSGMAVDAPAVQRRFVDHASMVDLAPPALPRGSMHSSSPTQSTSKSSVDWMPAFAGPANTKTAEVHLIRDAVGKRDKERISTADVLESPCSQPLTSSSRGSQKRIQTPGQKRPMPCPPLPRAPSFGVKAFPGQPTPGGRLQSSPQVASPKLSRNRSLGSSPAAHSPPIFTLTTVKPVLGSPSMMPSPINSANPDPCSLCVVKQQSLPAPDSDQPSAGQDNAHTFTSVPFNQDQEHFVIQSHSSLAQACVDAANPELEDTSSSGSGESRKENGPRTCAAPGKGQILPPALSSHSPGRRNERPSNVLGVHQHGLQAPASDLHDPSMSPSNPDCGLRWSLNSPQAGLVQEISSRLAACHDSSPRVAWVDQEGEFDDACVRPGPVSASSRKLHRGIELGWFSPRLLDSREVPPGITPLTTRLHGSCAAGKAGRCRSVHVSKPSCHAMRSPPGRGCHTPVHVLPSRIEQHTDGSVCNAARSIGWDFQMPNRTPLIVHSGRLHGAMSSPAYASKANYGLTNIDAVLHEGCYSGEVQTDITFISWISDHCHSIWLLLWWAIHAFQQQWEAVLLAWRTAVVPQQSWILLGVFTAATAARWSQSFLAAVVKGRPMDTASDVQGTQEPPDGADVVTDQVAASANGSRLGGIMSEVPRSPAYAGVVTSSGFQTPDSNTSNNLPVAADATKHDRLNREAPGLHIADTLIAGHASSLSPQELQPSSHTVDKVPAQVLAQNIAHTENVQHVDTLPGIHAAAVGYHFADPDESGFITTTSEVHVHKCHLLSQSKLPVATSEETTLAEPVAVLPVSDVTEPTQVNQQVSWTVFPQGECVIFATTSVMAQRFQMLQTEVMNGMFESWASQHASQHPCKWEASAGCRCTAACSEVDFPMGFGKLGGICDSCGPHASFSNAQESADLITEIVYPDHGRHCFMHSASMPAKNNLDVLASETGLCKPAWADRHADAGRLQHAEPWLLPSGVRWLMTVLVIGCVSAITQAYCKHQNKHSEFSGDRQAAGSVVNIAT